MRGVRKDERDGAGISCGPFEEPDNWHAREYNAQGINVEMVYQEANFEIANLIEAANHRYAAQSEMEASWVTFEQTSRQHARDMFDNDPERQSLTKEHSHRDATQKAIILDL